MNFSDSSEKKDVSDNSKADVKSSPESNQMFNKMFDDDYEKDDKPETSDKSNDLDKPDMDSLFADDMDKDGEQEVKNPKQNNESEKDEKNQTENGENSKTENVQDGNEGGETDEPVEKKGGSYRDVKKNSDGETHEVHHMPADSASKLDREDGPAIKMEKEDHRQTASCGSSKEAREYREKQKELIDQGKFKEALQMDIDDLHEKFGDKYDDAIAEMLEYVDKLEQEGKI